MVWGNEKTFKIKVKTKHTELERQKKSYEQRLLLQNLFLSTVLPIFLLIYTGALAVKYSEVPSPTEIQFLFLFLKLKVLSQTMIYYAMNLQQ